MRGMRGSKSHILSYQTLHSIRGVRGAVWFDFEGKSHPNCKVKKDVVWFGSVDF